MKLSIAGMVSKLHWPFLQEGMHTMYHFPWTRLSRKNLIDNYTNANPTTIIQELKYTKWDIVIVFPRSCGFVMCSPTPSLTLPIKHVYTAPEHTLPTASCIPKQRNQIGTYTATTITYHLPRKPLTSPLSHTTG
jgi:hypothetical protein